MAQHKATVQKTLESAICHRSYAAAMIAKMNDGAFVIPAAIVATNVSTTVDFGALQVGDKIAQIPAVAGNAHFLTCVTAGTLPEAAVVGDLYVVIRASLSDLV